MADPDETADTSFLTPEEIEALGHGDALDADGNLVATEAEPERDFDKEEAAEAAAMAAEEAEAAVEKAAEADPKPEPAASDDAPPVEAAATEEASSEVDDAAVAAAQAAAEIEQQAVAERIEATVAQRANAAKRKAITDFEEGQITSEEFSDALDAIADQAKWDREVWTYVAENKGLGEEGHAYAFSQAVKHVGQDPASDKLSYRQVLERAHDLYISAAGVSGLTPVLKAGAAPAAKAAAAKAPAPKADAPKAAVAPKVSGEADAAPKKATGPRPPPPTTLARTPAAEDSLVVDGRYGHLAILAEGDDAVALEEAMARLTPAQQEEFASLYI